MRAYVLIAIAVVLAGLSGCGYHTLGAATHLPPGVKTLAIPVFANDTVLNGTGRALTEAVIREFVARTNFRVIPKADASADAVLHGTVLNELITPLTYNTQTQQSSSFLITLVVSVTLQSRSGKILYQNNNYVYRQQYQSTTDLPTFFSEDPAAIQRLSSDFASQLAADVLEGF